MKRRSRIILVGSLLAIILALIGLRLALPSIVRNGLNKHMERMGDYHGHVADVDISLWRGAYTLDGLKIVKVSGKVPVPLLETPHMDIHLSWRALMHGAIRASVEFERPVLNFVDSNGGAGTQVGTGVDWRAQLQQLIPIRLDEVKVSDGTITFRNFVSHPRVDIKATRVEAVVTNLTNADRSKGRRVADMHATAQVLGEAPLDTSASFDPLGKAVDFTFELRILHIDLTRLNDLARAYAKLDFASGHGDFVMQLNARDGRLNGYAKPLFHDMKIFSWKQDVTQQHENPLEIAWQALAQGITSIFTNQKKDQFATRVPISGSIDDKQFGTWRAILNVLRNAFVKAYTPQLEKLRPAPRDQ
ncbi:MAG TPA: DUF748 domain-containing protein [Gemmataceae bacterium]|jgi:hypothetical protein|nr:DUF748 domain-containing protein [Gemmataceae bacterium]